MPGQPRKPTAYRVWFATSLLPAVVAITILVLTSCYDRM